MIHKLQVAAVFVLIPIVGLFLYAKNENIAMRDIFTVSTPIVHIGEIPISVEIANTPEKRTKGLSGRDEIGANGMLFIFDTIDRHGIWMKDMNFSIDIIWIDENLRVVAIDRAVRPDTYPRTFRSPTPVRYVIETVENYTDMFGISVGDEVRLPLSL
jgi:uncharacterized protein